MVNNSWVVNSSPLILLGKVGRLGLLADMEARIIIPSSVVEEVNVGREGMDLVSDFHSDAGFEIEKNVEVPSDLLAWDLGEGETQVIAVAMKNNAERVVLDDREARRCATSYPSNRWRGGVPTLFFGQRGETLTLRFLYHGHS